MATSTKKKILFFHLLVILLLAGVSCNSKTTEDEETIALTPAIVAVKEFRLQRIDSVLAHLDSVFFSIDLNSGVIFNADSLPKGTDVSKLLVKITFANNMTKVNLIFRHDNEMDTVDYLKNPTDTIDFSDPVALEVTALDGVNSFTYQVKVNVHKQDPDVIAWQELETSKLPSRLPNPLAQHTVVCNDMVYCLVEENNGEFTLSSSADLNMGQWEKKVFAPGFLPDVTTFTASSDSFFVLNVYGDLFESADLSSWNSTGENWATILGAYGDGILGVKSVGAEMMHAAYPIPEGFMETPIEKGFPIYNPSELGIIESEWADKPMAILAGGVTQEGEPSSSVWAYDGTNWAIINQGVLPALEKPMLARYVVYRDTPYIFTKRAFDVWLLIGGTSADKVINRDIYISYNNGVNWTVAPEAMQLSEQIPALRAADVIVAGYKLSADLSEAWTPTPLTKTRTEYTLDGYDITWICPYLYIFGGYVSDSDNSLNTDIYRGVLQRLKFTPSI